MWLPPELGWGSGMTCWRRLRDWQHAGVWDRLYRVLLDRLGDADQIDWSCASIDSASVPAKTGAQRPGRTRRIARNWTRIATYRRPLAPARRAPQRGEREQLGGRRARARAHSVASSAARPAWASPLPASEAARRQRLRPAARQALLSALRHRLPPRESAWSPARAWGATAGSSSARWPGGGSSGSSRSATSVASTFIRPCSRWPAAASAGTSSSGFVRCS
jgi:hypothetical protein